MFVVQKNWSYLKRNEFSLGMLRRRYRISLNVLKIDGYLLVKNTCHVVDTTTKT